MKKWITRIIFIAGFLLCCLPTVYGVYSQKEQSSAVATYKKKVENTDAEAVKKVLDNASEYNDMLYQSQGGVVGGNDILSDESYESQLNISGTGVMGSLEIPKINVDLPIYHGTGEESLSNGIGHMQGTSLPVGGTSTHCVLSGHRGLPSSKLLVRLDEVEEGDLFYLRVCGEVYAYRVCEIQVVEPDNTEVCEIQPEKDLVSIVTCTPYGINTHRLIVTGERVEYEKSEYESIGSGIPSIREIVFTVLPFVFLLAALIMYIVRRKKRNQYPIF